MKAARHPQLSTLNSPFKQTEVGVIPENWEVVSIGSLASFTSGNSISVAALHQQSSDTSVPVYGGNGIAGYTTRPLVQEPVVVVGRVGQKCGEVYLTQGPAWITDNALYPRTIFRVVDIRFLALAMKAAGLNEVKNRNDLPLVTQSILHSVRIPLPPTKAEQEAIAEALSDADALIESLEQLIAKKRQIKQGAMQELLIGKKRLPGFATKSGYKQTEVGVIPEDWEVKSLGSIASIATSNTPPTRDVANYDDEFLFVSPVDLGFSKYISRTEKMLSQKGFSISRPFPKGSILFVCIGSTIGKCGIALEILTSNQQINAILPSADFSSEYLYYAVSVVAPKVKSLAGEQAVPIVNKTQFAETVIPLPPTNAEQTAIATILSDIDAEIAALEAKLAKARQLKQGMMQELLTGRIRLI